jgi:hypothetical protein
VDGKDGRFWTRRSIWSRIPLDCNEVVVIGGVGLGQNISRRHFMFNTYLLFQRYAYVLYVLQLTHVIISLRILGYNNFCHLPSYCSSSYSSSRLLFQKRTIDRLCPVPVPLLSSSQKPSKCGACVSFFLQNYRFCCICLSSSKSQYGSSCCAQKKSKEFPSRSA